MKKIIKFVTMLLTSIFIGTFVACSTFSNPSPSAPPAPTTQEITMYNGDTPVNYTLTYGEVAQIDRFAKAGYYFTGAYDSAENGEKYFDIDGKSTSVWTAGNPDVYYARFESVSAIDFSQIQHEEDPLSWHTQSVWIEFTFDQALCNAVQGNLDKKLSVTIEFYATHTDDWSFSKAYLTNQKTGGERFYIIEDGAQLDQTRYTKYEKEFVVENKLLQDGKMYLRIETTVLINGNKPYSVKNAKLSAKFFEEQPTPEPEPEPAPTPSVAWEDYFEYDNVSITETVNAEYAYTPDGGTQTTWSEQSVSSLKIAGNEWLLQSEDETVYFDGSVAYLDGVIDANATGEKDIFLLWLDFSDKENAFTKNGETYSAQTLELEYGYTYENLTITISQDKLKTISYTQTTTSSAGGELVMTNAYTYAFTAWGETTINGSEYTQPSAWNTCFTFDNVTVNESRYYTVGGATQTSPLTTQWKIDGEKWLCEKDLYAVDDQVTQTDTAYFDGENAYLNGEITTANELTVYSLDFALSDFKSNESAFIKTQTGTQTTYTASEIEMYGFVYYTDVSINVIDGKISSIVYTYVNGIEIDGVTYPTTHTISFTNYGTTSIQV